MASKDPVARALEARKANAGTAAPSQSLSPSFNAAATGPRAAGVTPVFNSAAQAPAKRKASAPQPVLAPPGMALGAAPAGHAASVARKRQVVQAAAQSARAAAGPQVTQQRGLDHVQRVTPAFKRVAGG